MLATETYVELRKNPLVLSVKDAVGDFNRGAWLMRETGITIYSGDDSLNLGWLAYGACGIVSVVSHAAPRRLADLVAAVDARDLDEARAIQRQLLPIDRAMMTVTQGVITAKAVLQILGVLDNRTTRAPLPQATEDEVAMLRDALVASHLIDQT